ncbi:MAG: ferritin-like domain-containing protein [Pseudomonadota bacterium]|nr:ferritin-like domain-containing protein [Pseudomonadota bacterium]
MTVLAHLPPADADASRSLKHWTLDDIPWHNFDRSQVQPGLLSLVKAASMVEHNGEDYARYLCEVFSDDAGFQQAARQWAAEEVQHGEALRRWALLADPAFDFDKNFGAFTEGYQLPTQVSASVRGSRSGELIARCIVETGTSSYYTAIKDYTGEPVLKAICARIAGDELRHYKLFYTYLQRYQRREKIGLLRRLRVALGRIFESGDDELAYAFFAAHGASGRYDRKRSSNQYLALAAALYRRRHIEKMAAMLFKAVGLSPQSRLCRGAGALAWRLLQWRGRRLRNALHPA